MEKVCNKLKVDFSQAVTHFNKTYNEGYTNLDMKNVARPILHPPKGNKIGKHCVIPNAEMLKKYLDSEALDLILKYKKNG